MAAPKPLLSSFSGGMNQDIPREELGPGQVWNMVDYIPDSIGAPAVQRGGWTSLSETLDPGDGSALSVVAGIQAPFSAGTQLVALTEPDFNLYQIDSDGSFADIGGAQLNAALQNPVFHRDLVITPTKGVGPTGYDGSTMAYNPISGAPAASYACVYKDRTLLANDGTNTERVWFSAAGDPTTWDTTNSWIDSSFAINGLAALRNTVLLFSDNITERLTGSTPPPGSDFTLDTLVAQGCTDARSIVIFGDFAIWANPSGIWMSDGAASTDLTQECGAKSYWRKLMDGYDRSNWTLAAGFYGTTYVISLIAGGTPIDTLAFDVPSKRWWRYSNIDAACFWRSSGSEEELYWGRTSVARVAGLSSIYTPSRTDADGTPILGLIETPFFVGRFIFYRRHVYFYAGSPTIHRWRFLYLGYDLRDDDNEAGFLVSYIDSPEQTEYTTMAPTVPPSNYVDRWKIPVNLGRYGLGFKITRINAADHAKIYSLEADFADQEGQRLYNRSGTGKRAPKVPPVGSRSIGSIIPGNPEGAGDT